MPTKKKQATGKIETDERLYYSDSLEGILPEEFLEIQSPKSTDFILIKTEKKYVRVVRIDRKKEGIIVSLLVSNFSSNDFLQSENIDISLSENLYSCKAVSYESPTLEIADCILTVLIERT